MSTAHEHEKSALLEMAIQRELNARYVAVTALQVMMDAILEAKRRSENLPPADAIRTIMHALAKGNLDATMELESAMSRMHEASIIRLGVADPK